MKTKYKFDEEELEILDAFENNKLVKSPTEKQDIENAKLAAKNTLDMYEEVKVKLPLKDMQNLKKKALETGVPFDSLISAIVHKYLDNINITFATK